MVERKEDRETPKQKWSMTKKMQVQCATL